ncbi:MAG: hypothetical protein K1W26_06445 [Acetatifactor sp.]
MKNISIYRSKKYEENSYEKIADGIFSRDGEFFVSIRFEQEPEYGEEIVSGQISQYPLEDILDEYMLYVSDFYEELNANAYPVRYVELAGGDESDVRRACEMVGKHIYNRTVMKDGREYSRLVIE